MQKAPGDFTILIVDDDPDLRELLATDFVMRGFGVIQAGNASEALERFDRSRVDLVISDYLMPTPGKKGADTGCDLLEKMQKLCAEKKQDPPPMILLTGFGDLLPEELGGVKAAAVFGKPIDRRELLRFIYTSCGLPTDTID